MAIAMQRRMRELQLKWRDLGSEKPFQLRIGINTGFCTVGNSAARTEWITRSLARGDSGRARCKAGRIAAARR
jgi:class 3 adenylate cyclase